MPIDVASADEESENVIVRTMDSQLYGIGRPSGWLKPLSTIEEEPVKLMPKMAGKMALYRNILYWVENGKLVTLNTQGICEPRSYPFHKASVRELFFIFSYQ